MKCCVRRHSHALLVDILLLLRREPQPEDTEYDASLPTIWSEVGGGGHSMSDLWGLRDELVNKHHRKYCSYDMPGTGHSSPIVLGAAAGGGKGDMQDGYVTDLVIEAMGMQEEPMVMMGSMDGVRGESFFFFFCACS